MLIHSVYVAKQIHSPSLPLYIRHIPPVPLIVFLAFSGTTIISFFWEFAVQIAHKQSCHRQFYLVIACILVFLLQQLMLLQQIAGSRFSITQGRTFVKSLFGVSFFFFNIYFLQGKPFRVCHTTCQIFKGCVSYAYLCGDAFPDAF